MTGTLPAMTRFLLGSSLLTGVALPVHAAELKALRVWAGPEYTRAVFDVSGPVEYRVFELEKPDRLVLDVQTSTFAAGYAAAEANGLLKAVRSGKHGKRDLRVVFDLAEGVRPKSFLLPPAEKFGPRPVHSPSRRWQRHCLPRRRAT